MEKKICLSIEQMQKLKDLSVETKDASLCWVRDPEGNYSLSLHDESCYEMAFMNPVPAFTLQDILCMMPELYPIDVTGLTILDTDGVHSDSNEIYSPTLYLYDGKWVCGYISSYDSEAWVEFLANNPLDAAFDMLVWLAENGYLKKEA